MEEPIRVGISACLLGRAVRYDGGHKRDPYLVETLGRFFTWVPVCPEVELGLGTPRPTIRIEWTGVDHALVEPKSRTDLSSRMNRYAKQKVKSLRPLELSGFVLKKNSPSCGMERVRVYREDGGLYDKRGKGFFARALCEAFPHLPIEEEGRLHDPALRDNWITRVFAYHRLQGLFRNRWSIGDLVRFHTAHKLLLMAHSPAHYRSLGKLVAEAKRVPRRTLRETYTDGFMSALRRRATTAKNVNVLQHILGYFKRNLPADVRAELHGLVEDYRAGVIPLVVPITLIAHYAKRLEIDYLLDQVYLQPHPKELGLRSSV
ncbi:MAG: DUF1722 domain-containing protein [Planctomycetota bacterium]|nr:MAG: DUF1722 domain-containing protein [Planctomycetota bacterium]